MKNLKLFEDFNKKFVVIGKWKDSDIEEQWDILSGREPVTYEDAIRIKNASNKAWTDNIEKHHLDTMGYFDPDAEIFHNEFIITWEEYQKMLYEDPEYQKELLKKYNL